MPPVKTSFASGNRSASEIKAISRSLESLSDGWPRAWVIMGYSDPPRTMIPSNFSGRVLGTGKRSSNGSNSKFVTGENARIRMIKDTAETSHRPTFSRRVQRRAVPINRMNSRELFGSAIKNFSFVLHEWMGICAYWVLGRTSELFPGPAE